MAEDQAKRRRPVSDADRERIIQANDNGETPKAIASMLGLKLYTVYEILRQYWKHGKVRASKRGGVRNRKLSPAAIADIEKWLDEDCSISLRSIASKVLSAHSISVSTTTLSRLIFGFRYMFTRITTTRQESRRATATELKNYADQFYELPARIADSGIVYISAADFNICLRSSTNIVRRRNVSIMCAMTRTTVLVYTVDDRPLDSATYATFAKNVGEKLIEFSQSVIILNHELDCLYNEFKSVMSESCDVLQLPPACKELNPVESMFSEMNNIVRKAKPENEPALICALKAGASLITLQDCDRYIRSMFYTLSRCLQQDESK